MPSGERKREKGDGRANLGDDACILGGPQRWPAREEGEMVRETGSSRATPPEEPPT